MKKILLYSGGMDSWLMNKLWKPDILVYVNLHGRYNAQEISHLPENCQILDFDLSKYERPDKIIPLRNLFLVMLATITYVEEKDEEIEILLGATAGDRVLDKSLIFAEKTSDLLTYLYQSQWWNPIAKNIKVSLEYKNKTKTDLIKMFLAQGGTVEEVWKESFSCYEPDEAGNICYACKPCFRKACACYECGFRDFSEEAKAKLMEYIGKEIVPQIEAGSYGRGSEEETQIMDFYQWLKTNQKSQ